MSPTFDPSSDLAAVADGLEPVTVLRRGTSDALAIAHALRRQVTTQEAAASDGHYTQADVRWWLPQAECGVQPALGDTLADSAGTRWTVIETAESRPTGRWQCTCRNLAIVHALDDTITVEKVMLSKDPQGAVVKTWATWQTGIRARIQPAAAQMPTEQGLQYTLRKFVIFIAEELPLDHTHRIRAADGTTYKITGWTRAQRIGELQTIDAEVTPWTSW
jgi:head-tail adaptor